MRYTPEQLEEMADRHDRYSVCTQPARDHFAEVCRELAALLRREDDDVSDGLYGFGELRDTGLLWLINTSVFHPRGVALAFSYRDDDPEHLRPTGWQLLAAGPGECWQFGPGVDIDDLFRKAEVTLSLAEKSEPSS